MFRKYDKIITAAALANPKNNFLVRFRNKVTDPTPYYLSSTNEKVISNDPFEVALVATHLLRRTQADTTLANSIQSKDTDILKFVQRLGNDIDETASVLQDYIIQLRKLLAIGTSSLPVQTLISAVYVLELTEKSDKALYDKKLFPELRNKLKYASYSNLADLTEALIHGKIFSDRALWTAILDALSAKASEVPLKDVEYSGWDLDKYEPADAASKKEYLTENEQYYKDLKSGGEFSAAFSKEIRRVWDYISSTGIQWLFFNERRVGSQLGLTEEKVNLERLAQDLAEVAKNIPELSSAAQKIQGSIKSE